MCTNQVNCKNCEQPYDESFQFCPHCGQKTNDKLTIRVLFYNTISNYFSFDARFLKSFIPLLFKPGYLAKEFIKGKRLLYLHPAQMYLFISVVFFFLFSFTIRETKDTINNEFQSALENGNIKKVDSVAAKMKDSLNRIELRNTLEKSKIFTRMSEKEIDSIVSQKVLPKKNAISLGPFQVKIDSLLKAKAPDSEIYKTMGVKEGDGWFKHKFYEQLLKFYKARDAGSIMSEFYDKIPLALFFLLPIFALILKLFYFRKGRYVQHLVFSFYYFSFVFTIFTLIFLLNLIPGFPGWLNFLISISCFFYLYIALKRFYGQGWFLSFVKTCISSLIFFPVVIFTVLAIGFFAFLFY